LVQIELKANREKLSPRIFVSSAAIRWFKHGFQVAAPHLGQRARGLRLQAGHTTTSVVTRGYKT
jgi:hypothetical protein